MLYYRVKPEFDQVNHYNKRGHIVTTYIENELYTAKEVHQLGLNPKCLEPVQVSKRNIYWSFGVRRAIN